MLYLKDKEPAVLMRVWRSPVQPRWASKNGLIEFIITDGNRVQTFYSKKNYHGKRAKQRFAGSHFLTSIFRDK